jgi:hypothetical protein
MDHHTNTFPDNNQYLAGSTSPPHAFAMGPGLGRHTVKATMPAGRQAMPAAPRIHLISPSEAAACSTSAS